VRRSAWNEVRIAGRANDERCSRGRPATNAPAQPDSIRATSIKNSRYALWKNPENLTHNQTAILASIKQGLSNRRIESVNTKIRLMTRIAFAIQIS
jgi:transposase